MSSPLQSNKSTENGRMAKKKKGKMRTEMSMLNSWFVCSLQNITFKILSYDSKLIHTSEMTWRHGLRNYIGFSFHLVFFFIYPMKQKYSFFFSSVVCVFFLLIHSINVCFHIDTHYNSRVSNTKQRISQGRINWCKNRRKNLNGIEITIAYHSYILLLVWTVLFLLTFIIGHNIRRGSHDPKWENTEKMWNIWYNRRYEQTLNRKEVTFKDERMVEMFAWFGAWHPVLALVRFGLCFAVCFFHHKYIKCNRSNIKCILFMGHDMWPTNTYFFRMKALVNYTYNIFFCNIEVWSLLKEISTR